MDDSGHCSFIISGETLNFEDITKNLRIKPSEILRKGEIINDIIGENLLDVFICEELIHENTTLNKTLLRLVEKLIPHKNYIKKLSETTEIVARCYIQSDYAQVYFYFTPGVLASLVDLNIKLEISILSWGGVST